MGRYKLLAELSKYYGKASINQFLTWETEQLKVLLDEVNTKDCEKCGEPVGVKLVGDESYDYCKDCNWITN